MNKNALNQKSSIKIKKTMTGAINLGTPAMDGYTMAKEDYYKSLVRNGYKVTKTRYGVIVSR